MTVPQALGRHVLLPANRVFQERIGYLLKRPVGRPSHDVRRSYANFTYQAGSWTKARRVVAKVEWNPGELYPRVGFIVTNMSRPAESVVAFYTSAARVNNGSRKARARSDGPGFPAAHSPPKRCGFGFMRSLTTYNLGNFLRTLATPEPPQGKADQDRCEDRQPRPLCRFQVAEVTIPKNVFANILRMIAELRPPPLTATA